MNILVLSVGASSVKFQPIGTGEAHFAGNTDRRLARGQIERIGGESVWSFRTGDGEARRGEVARDTPQGMGEAPLLSGPRRATIRMAGPVRGPVHTIRLR